MHQLRFMMMSDSPKYTAPASGCEVSADSADEYADKWKGFCPQRARVDLSDMLGIDVP